jgi:hypothetical protein
MNHREGKNLGPDGRSRSRDIVTLFGLGFWLAKTATTRLSLCPVVAVRRRFWAFGVLLMREFTF